MPRQFGPAQKERFGLNYTTLEEASGNRLVVIPITESSP
jgi:hypothetical protein